jgi:hypothetical protein
MVCIEFEVSTESELSFGMFFQAPQEKDGGDVAYWPCFAAFPVIKYSYDSDKCTLEISDSNSGGGYLYRLREDKAEVIANTDALLAIVKEKIPPHFRDIISEKFSGEWDGKKITLLGMVELKRKEAAVSWPALISSLATEVKVFSVDHWTLSDVASKFLTLGFRETYLALQGSRNETMSEKHEEAEKVIAALDKGNGIEGRDFLSLSVLVFILLH